MIESRHAEFATQHAPSAAPLLAAALPAVFFCVLGAVWYATNNWLAGFVFLFTLFVAIGSWWEERQLRRITESTLRSRPAAKILLNAHYAEVGRRTPELLRGAFIIAAVIPAVLAYA
jgi:hypothetical protein